MESEPTGSDAVVIGAGAVGCAVAWRLAREGLRTVLVERARPGAEASGAAAGILAAGHEGAGDGRFFRLLLDAERRWATFAAELEGAGAEAGYLRSGAFDFAFGDDEAAAFRARAEWQRDAGLPVEWLDAKQARARAPGLAPEAAGALFFPEAAQVDSQRLCGVLAAVAARAGARLLTGEVRRVLVENGRAAGVDLGGRTLAAGAVVVAAGAWSALVDGTGLARGAVRPVRGQIVAFDLPVPFTQLALSSRGYLVPRADGRVIAGSTMEEVGFDSRVTGEGVRSLLERAARLCPALAQAEVTALWAGLRPACVDGLPAIGAVPGVPGLHLAAGLLRNGILLAPLAADLIAASVLGRPLELAPQFAAARLFS